MANRLLTVAEAASILEVTPDAVRKLLVTKRLEGTKRGRDWAIDPAAVERRRRQRPNRGRPLSAETSWGVILESSGAPSLPADWIDPARARGRRWLDHHQLPDHAAQLRNRATLERFDAHPSQIPTLLERSLAVTGISVAESVGLAGGPGNRAEVYASADSRTALVEELGLLPGDGPVAIRWVPAEFQQAASSEPMTSRAVTPAPRTAVLLDLLESDEPRARREAARALAA